jgi:hypothetical protein
MYYQQQDELDSLPISWAEDLKQSNETIYESNSANGMAQFSIGGRREGGRSIQSGQSSNYFLQFCAIVSITTAATLVFDFFTQVICLMIITKFQEPRDLYLLVYRLYGVMFVTIAIFCELEWTETIRTTAILQFWSTRGLFYIFISLFTLQEYAEIEFTFLKISLQLFVNTIGICLLTLGLIYTAMVRPNQ